LAQIPAASTPLQAGSAILVQSQSLNIPYTTSIKRECSKLNVKQITELWKYFLHQTPITKPRTMGGWCVIAPFSKAGTFPNISLHRLPLPRASKDYARKLAGHWRVGPIQPLAQPQSQRASRE
jgi:hypothetical protein